MSKTDAKKIVKKYADKLKSENFNFKEIYLFGSYAKGKAGKWSDIDVAVVSDKLNRNYDKNRFLLWKYTRDVDLRIEPIGFSTKDFKVDYNPIVAEIKQTGVKVV